MMKLFLRAALQLMRSTIHNHMPRLHWSLDSLVIRNGTVFGAGWVFHDVHAITNVLLRIMGDAPDAAARKIPVEFGKLREDVALAHPRFEQAINSGFLIFGMLPSGSIAASSLVLECHLADGSVVLQKLPASFAERLDAPQAAVFRPHRLRRLLHAFRQGLGLLRRGQFEAFSAKARQFLRARPQEALPSALQMDQLLLPEERAAVTWWVDHNLGGGANLYRRHKVNALVAEGRTVIVLTFQVSTLSPVLLIQNQRQNLQIHIPDLHAALDLARTLTIDSIIYNNAVSFPNPEKVAEFLLALQRSSNARLLFLIHDYFAICPSQYLLGHDGRFCNIPDAKQCAACLAQNHFGFVTLFSKTDIRAWRAHWGQVLQHANEIRAFSNSSAALVHKAHPQIPLDKITVVPHTVEYLHPTAIQIPPDPRLRIGVVGTIGFHKGLRVVQALAEEIKRRGANAEICVIGVLDGQADPSVVQQTGPYDQQDLAQLIQDSKTNVMLFPSIWPETFSYVVQELMEMQLPVAAFNFGAPAERLRVYPKGLILDSMEPAAILQALTDFHHAMYLA